MTQQPLTAVPMPLDALQHAGLRAQLQAWQADGAAGAVQASTLHHAGVPERGEALINEGIDRAGVAWEQEPTWYDAGTIAAVLVQLT